MKRVLLALLIVALAGCDRVSFVDHLTLDNPTEYDVLVHVKGEAGSSWLALGQAKNGRKTTREMVIDMGDTWLFRFSYVGEDAGEHSISRSELIKNKWVYRIPDEVGERLKAKGIPPSVDFR